jgi:hypothetical protein
MLTFVTSLRHPHNSNDYGRVESLLAETLRSVTQQDSDAYRVVVVGNQAPSIPLPPKVRFVEVDFEPPSRTSGPQTGHEAVLLDKGTKLAVGVLAARDDDPSHIMVFDADDYLSRRIAGTVEGADPRADGWYIDQGYIYSPTRHAVRPHNNFNYRCGTSHIVRTDLYRLPADLSERSTQTELLERAQDSVSNLLGSHMSIKKRFDAEGTPLRRLGYRGAVYNVGTGENHSGKGLRGIAHPVSAAMASEFGLPATPGGARTLLDAYGPRYVAQSVGSAAVRPVHLARRAAAKVSALRASS